MLFLSTLESFSVKLGEHVRYIVVCINLAFTKMIDETGKPTFAIRTVRYNKFRFNTINNLITSIALNKQKCLGP